MLSKGEKVYVITRRLFAEDLRRHFVGEVQVPTGATVRVCGYEYVYDEITNDFVRRDGLRTRIFSLIDAGIVINVIPAEVILEDIRYGVDGKNHRIVTDGKSFTMNVSEFGARR